MQQPENSYSMTRNILRVDLSRKPYKIHTSHLMKPTDYPNRLIFAKWLLELSRNIHKWFICSDELTSKPYVNKQNELQNNL